MVFSEEGGNEYYMASQGLGSRKLLKVKIAQLCLTLCDLMDCIVHGILQARILEWVAFPFSGDLPWDQGSHPSLLPHRQILYELSQNFHVTLLVKANCKQRSESREFLWSECLSPLPNQVKFMCWLLTTEGYGVSRWSFVEVLWSWKWSPYEWDCWCLVTMSNSFGTPRTVACQALLSRGFSRQEYCSGLPFPPPRDLPHQGT